MAECLKLAAQNKPFRVKDSKAFVVEAADLTRIFFKLSDLISLEHKFLGWSEKHKYLFERIMGCWYAASEDELSVWKSALMRSLADSGHRKSLSESYSELNQVSRGSSSLSKHLQRYDYVSSTGKKTGFSANLHDTHLIRVLCDLHELVEPDNCRACRAVHFLLDCAIDLRANRFFQYEDRFLEVFVFYAAQYLFTKQRIRELELTLHSDDNRFELICMRRKAVFAKFVLGFCFRNFMHFQHVPQDLSSLGWLVRLVRQIYSNSRSTATRLFPTTHHVRALSARRTSSGLTRSSAQTVRFSSRAVCL